MLLRRNLNSNVKNSQNCAIDLPCVSAALPAMSVLRLSGEVEEVNIFETRIDGREAIAGTGVGAHADLMQAADKVSGDDVEGSLESAELVIGSDDLGPDLTAEGFERFVWRAFEEKLSVRDDGHAGAELAHVVDYVGGENDSHV